MNRINSKAKQGQGWASRRFAWQRLGFAKPRCAWRGKGKAAHGRATATPSLTERGAAKAWPSWAEQRQGIALHSDARQSRATAKRRTATPSNGRAWHCKARRGEGKAAQGYAEAEKCIAGQRQGEASRCVAKARLGDAVPGMAKARKTKNEHERKKQTMSEYVISPPFRVDRYGDIIDSSGVAIVACYIASCSSDFMVELCAVMNENSSRLCHAANGEEVAHMTEAERIALVQRARKAPPSPVKYGEEVAHDS